MNKFYKKIFAIIIVISSSTISANPTNEDKYISLQFAPVMPAPFSQDKDDQYLAGILAKTILVDEEVHNNPRLKKSPSIVDFVAQGKNDHVLISKKPSFGWNDPFAIISAMFYNGVAETPNELIATIEKSVEYPGKYKAIFKGRGLYADKKTAHGKLATFVQNGPQDISKYKKLEEITTLENLFDSKTNSFKNSEKIKLAEQTPSLQGKIKCDCYFHGCDVQGVIYFDEATLAYLIQSINGNKHKNNTVQRVKPIVSAQVVPVQVTPVPIAPEMPKQLQQVKPLTTDVIKKPISDVLQDTLATGQEIMSDAFDEDNEENDEIKDLDKEQK